MLKRAYDHENMVLGILKALKFRLSGLEKELILVSA
jgi:hypothetical protein